MEPTSLYNAKVEAYRIALTLSDDDSADVVCVKPRRFEVMLNTTAPVRPTFCVTGWEARWYKGHHEYAPDWIPS